MKTESHRGLTDLLAPGKLSLGSRCLSVTGLLDNDAMLMLVIRPLSRLMFVVVGSHNGLPKGKGSCVASVKGCDSTVSATTRFEV